MFLEELQKEVNLPYKTLSDMVYELQAVGFTEDQMIAIIKCIIAWGK